MTDINQKRDFVSNRYPGPKWKARVRKMSDAQVVAIYLKEQNSSKKEK